MTPAPVASLADRLKMALGRYAADPVLAPLAAQSPLVPPIGPMPAPVMILGEAPGREETIRGAPFVGPAGAHLNHLLKRAGLNRAHAFVTNAVMFRPPGNRTPLPFEYMAGRGLLREEIAIVAPTVLISLGAVAWNTIGRMTMPLGTEPPSYHEARGKWHTIIPVSGPSIATLCTWHPSAALRSAQADEELAAHLKTILGVSA